MLSVDANYKYDLLNEKKRRKTIKNFTYSTLAFSYATLAGGCYHFVSHNNSIPAVVTSLAAAGIIYLGMQYTFSNKHDTKEIDSILATYEYAKQRLHMQEYINCEYEEIKPEVKKITLK